MGKLGFLDARAFSRRLGEEDLNILMAQGEEGGRWVTIRGNPVFIRDTEEKLGPGEKMRVKEYWDFTDKMGREQSSMRGFKDFDSLKDARDQASKIGGKGKFTNGTPYTKRVVVEKVRLVAPAVLPYIEKWRS